MSCNEAVLNFFEEHTRPFSSSDILSGVKGDFGKAAVQKALEFLVKQGKVKEKTYGKQKVYFLPQSSNDSSNLKEELLDLDRQINEHNLNLKELSDQYKSKSKTLDELKGVMSVSEAIDQKVKLTNEIEIVQEKIKQFEGIVLIDPNKKKEVQENYDKYLNEYKKRKRLTMDMLNAILENYPKTKKQLYDDIGLEMDEDVGFSLGSEK